MDLSLVAESRSSSPAVVRGLLIAVALSLQSRGSRLAGFSSCGPQALEQEVNSCGLTGLAAPCHVESSWSLVTTVHRITKKQTQLSTQAHHTVDEEETVFEFPRQLFINLLSPIFPSRLQRAT